MSIHSLGYVTVTTTDRDKWRLFATEVIGMMDNSSVVGQDNSYFKIDGRPYRLIVESGAEERYGSAAWETAGKAEMDAVIAKLRASGCEVTEGTAEQIAARQVQALAHFTDPDGNRNEIYWGMSEDATPFISPAGVSEFVTGDMGLGHAVLPAANNYTETLAFYTDVLGFGVSDYMSFRYTDDPNEPEKRLHFLHCNGRHHSLALFEQEFPTGCVHLMTEMATVDDVGHAMDRREANGVPLASTIGRHINDQMFSFYMVTPGGFMWEIGSGGRVVDDWDSFSDFPSNAPSLWGHDFSVGQPPPE